MVGRCAGEASGGAQDGYEDVAHESGDDHFAVPVALGASRWQGRAPASGNPYIPARLPTLRDRRVGDVQTVLVAVGPQFRGVHRLGTRGQGVEGPGDLR